MRALGRLSKAETWGKSWAASLSQALQKLNYYCGVAEVGPVHYCVTFAAKPLGLQIHHDLAVKDVPLTVAPRFRVYVEARHCTESSPADEAGA